MADDFLSNSSEDREHDQAKLRRRKIRKNAAPVKKSMFPRLINCNHLSCFRCYW
jgi:hypothetical protein